VTAGIAVVGAVLAVVALWAAGSGRRRRCRGIRRGAGGVRRGARSDPAGGVVVAPAAAVGSGIRSSGSGRGVRRYRRGVGIPNPSGYRKFASRIGLPECRYRNSDFGIGFHDLSFANWVSGTDLACVSQLTHSP
jgi:hypothetical protein